MDSVDAIINEVVHQFADPLAFFRELVQNSIDAGSGEIAVSFEWADGQATLRVDDFGEGMTREIIESKLTRLFASSKDEDFTKIGHFGIGFASVFAIEPDWVVVDTARAGEQWRVLFHPDKTWELMVLDAPREGTSVNIIKAMSEAEFSDLRTRATQVLKYWCRYAHVPIFVEDVDIREPFDIEAMVKVTYSTQETRIVAGLVDTRDTKVGYYNRGLTLMEGQSSDWPYMTFRIESRYLEHTLTRDRVRETDHWQRVVEILDDVRQTLLPNRFVEMLSDAAAKGDVKMWRDLCLMLPQAFRAFPDEMRSLRSLPFLIVEGGILSPAEAKRLSKKSKFFRKSESHVAKGLDATFMLGDDAVVDAVSQTFDFPILPPEAVFIAPLVKVENVDGLQALCDALCGMHKRLNKVLYCDLDYPGSPVTAEAAIWTKREASHIDVRDWTKVRSDEFTESPVLYLNASNKSIQHAMTIAQREPEFAAYVLTKLLTARTGISIETDSMWMKLATQRRAERRGQG